MKITWLVSETFQNLSSWFFHNIQYLHHPKFTINIRYKSINHGDYVIDIKKGKSTWNKVQNIDLFTDLRKSDVLIYSGHCAPLYVKEEKSLDDMEKILKK